MMGYAMNKDLDRQTIDDFDVQALIDDELSGPRRTQVIERIKETSELQKRYEQLSTQRDLLKLWWAATK